MATCTSSTSPKESHIEYEMKLVWTICAWVLATGTVWAAEPFRLPVGARTVKSAAVQGGWQVSGQIEVPYVQARARFMSAVTAAGWTLRHEIPLAGRDDRTILAFLRGAYELTLMVSRVSTSRSAFSYGVSRRDDNQRKGGIGR